MKTFIKNLRGVSNIVGALMLVLIVVSASASLAIFVSQRQQERQEQEAYKQSVKLEQLEIGSFKLVEANSTRPGWLNFTILSRHLSNSQIVAVRVNNGILYDPVNVSHNNSVTIQPSGISKINVTFNDSYKGNKLIKPDKIPSFNDTLTIEISTVLGNTFTKTFYPPTPIIYLESKTLPTYETYYILDGSKSNHIDNNAYLVKWEWNVTNTSSTPKKYLETKGRMSQITNTSFITSDFNYTITLTVTDNYGMKSTSKIELKF